MPKYIDSHGRELHLGDEFGRGGEGVVYAVRGHSDKAAKIYLRDASPHQAAKLTAMTAMTDKQLQLGGWPIDTVHEPNGKFVGFVMPKFEGHLPLWYLYNPKMRLQHFPGRDWRFLFAAATNAARAFDAMHRAGVVIGDVNYANLLVAQDATSRFIDCDSFQITYGGQQFTCDVGTPEYQPPEMPDAYRGVVRTTKSRQLRPRGADLPSALCRSPSVRRHLPRGWRAAATRDGDQALYVCLRRRSWAYPHAAGAARSADLGAAGQYHPPVRGGVLADHCSWWPPHRQRLGNGPAGCRPNPASVQSQSGTLLPLGPLPLVRHRAVVWCHVL